MDEKIASIKKNSTWKLILRPKEKKELIDAKWSTKKEECQKRSGDVQGEIGSKRL